MYKIVVLFASSLTQAALVAAIQSAYEAGVTAGEFILKENSNGQFEVTFERVASEDAEYLCSHLESDYLLSREPEKLVANAAFKQLHRELTDAEDTSGFADLLFQLEANKAGISEGMANVVEAVSHHAKGLLKQAA